MRLSFQLFDNPVYLCYTDEYETDSKNQTQPNRRWGAILWHTHQQGAPPQSCASPETSEARHKVGQTTPEETVGQRGAVCQRCEPLYQQSNCGKGETLYQSDVFVLRSREQIQSSIAKCVSLHIVWILCPRGCKRCCEHWCSWYGGCQPAIRLGCGLRGGSEAAFSRPQADPLSIRSARDNLPALAGGR